MIGVPAMSARSPESEFVRWREHGDPDALAFVFDALAPGLHRLAVHVAGDAGVAEDLVQTTFLVAIEQARTYDAARPLSPWLGGILLQHARKLRTDGWRARRVVDESSLERIDAATPLERAEANEDQEELLRAIDALEEPYRTVVLLRVKHGLDAAEIAHVVHASPGAVRVQLHRARELLRKSLPAGFAAALALLAPEARGLESIKAAVLAHVSASKASAGVAGIVGGLVMAKKLALVALVLALAAWLVVLVRDRPEEPAMASLRAEAPRTELSRAESAEPAAPIDVAARVEVLATSATHDAVVGADSVKLNGRVLHSETLEPIAGARVELFAPQRMRYSQARRLYSDRMYFDAFGKCTGGYWPRFADELSELALFDGEDVTFHAPPQPGVLPIAVATSDARGEFAIVVPKTLGFLVASADGFATRNKSLAPKDVNKEGAAEVPVLVLMRSMHKVFGYIVDESMQRIEDKVRLSFWGVLNKAGLRTPGQKRNELEQQLDRDPQNERWSTVTRDDGSFECELGAVVTMTDDEADPAWTVVKHGVLDPGAKDVKLIGWIEPGALQEPLVIVMKRTCALLVRDRETRAPIEEIHVECTSALHGNALRCGWFFARDGLLRLSRPEDGVMTDEAAHGPCTCTVWAHGYAPSTTQISSLKDARLVEVDLERAETPRVTGRAHDDDRPVEGASITLRSSLDGTAWTPPGGRAIAMTKSGVDGSFELRVPNDRYVLHVRAGDVEEHRRIDVPLATPIDVDLAVETGLALRMFDVAGTALADHPYKLVGPDGRVLRGLIDPRGTRLTRLPAGRYALHVQNVPRSAFNPTLAAQLLEIDVREGVVETIDVVRPSTTPRFAKLVVASAETLEGWLAGESSSGAAPATRVEPNGRIPIDVTGKAALEIESPQRVRWTAVLPPDVPDGFEIHITPDGPGIVGTIVSSSDGRPLANVVVLVQPVDDAVKPALAMRATTSIDGSFAFHGLSADRQYMRLQRWPRDEERDPQVNNVAIVLRAAPSVPPTRIDLVIPTRTDDGRFDGVELATVTGKVVRSSGPVAGLRGKVISSFERDGYELQLHADVLVRDDGTYEARVPRSSEYAVSLYDPATWKTVGFVHWTADATREREVHDVEMP